MVFKVKDGLQVDATQVFASNSDIYSNTLFYTNTLAPSSPSIVFDFAKSRKLDPRINYSRLSNATYIDYKGMVVEVSANTPRFQYSNGQCDGLLIEYNSTNRFLYSADWANTSWNKVLATATSNSTIAPDGSNTGTLIVDTLVTGNHTVDQQITVTTSRPYTLSAFIKQQPSSTKWVMLIWRPSDVSSFAYAHFYPGNGAVGAVSSQNANVANVTASSTLLSNGWYRVSLSIFNNHTTGSLANVGLRLKQINDGSSSYLGDGTGAYLWGGQVEEFSYYTSYIPTTTAQVTRAQDTANVTGTNFSNFYNHSEGTLVVTAKPPVVQLTGNSTVNGRTSAIVTISDGTYNNRIYFGRNQSTDPLGFVGTIYGNSGVNIFNNTTAANVIPLYAGVTQTTAFGYKTNDFGLAGDGLIVTGDTGVVTNTFTTMSIGAGAEGGNGLWNSTISRIAYYSKKFSNNELLAVTQQ